MKKWTINKVIAVLAVVLAVCLLVGALYAQPFADFAKVDRATEFYIYTTSAGAGHVFQESRPSRQEMAALLELLEVGSLRLDGRSRYIRWEGEDALYHLSFYYEENGVWDQDANFDLCTDGMVYVHHQWLGYICYRLTGCDMDAVETALMTLPGMT